MEIAAAHQSCCPASRSATGASTGGGAILSLREVAAGPRQVPSQRTVAVPEVRGAVAFGD